MATGNASPSWNPLKCSGTDLPLNLTIMVKVLAIVILIVNHARIMPDPWLPFIPGIDLIPPMLFKGTLQIVFVFSAVAIVFNRRVRLFSLLLGSTILLAVVSSKAYYGNNKTFCGLMFFLAGLYQPGGPPFIRWQLALTYFGAGLNKALDGDWHSGVFFDNWAVNRLQHPTYIALDAHLPPLVLGKLMCWGTIFAELGTVPLLLIPQFYFWGNLLNILFQAGLLLFTGGTFTLFFYAMSAASLAFVTWPSAPLRVEYNPDRAMANRARVFLQAWDMDRLFLWTPTGATTSVRLWWENKVYSGFRALRMIVLFNPVTYFAIAGSIAAVGYLPDANLYRRLIVGISLLVLLPPLAWFADRLERERTPQSAGMAPIGAENP